LFPTSISVFLNITGTFNDDLDVFLIAPNGVELELFTDVGSGGDGIQITLTDTASTIFNEFVPVSNGAQVTGTFLPENGSLISTFGSFSTAGTWFLKVRDDGNNDSHTLQGWALAFTY